MRKLDYMSATVVRKKRQTTLPEDVCTAAGIHVQDQVDWRVEDGEIRGKVLRPVKHKVVEHIMKMSDKDGWPTWVDADKFEVPAEAIAEAVRKFREEP